MIALKRVFIFLLAFTWLVPVHPFSTFARSPRLRQRFQKMTALRAVSGSRPTSTLPPCVIKVIGVGGGGSNAVIRMVEHGVKGVQFGIMNTDVQALQRAPEGVAVVELGRKLTGGLGAGGVPSVGKLAAEESIEEIEKLVSGADMVFITAGMGGGTGSGAAEVVAAAAQRAGALSIGVVTKPFGFEGTRRMRQALESISNLRPNVDALIAVSNDKLLEFLPDTVPMTEALVCADDILRQGVIGISDIIIQPGLINVDFADVRSVLLHAGSAFIGIGSASGPNRARDAALKAVSSPLLDIAIAQAKGAVFNVVGGPDLTIGDVSVAASVINDAMSPNAMIIFGSTVDESLPSGSPLTITMVATGFEQDDEDYPAAAGTSTLRTSTSSGQVGGRRTAQHAAAHHQLPRSLFQETPSTAGHKHPSSSEMNRHINDEVEAPSHSNTNEIPEFLKRLKRKSKY